MYGSWTIPSKSSFRLVILLSKFYRDLLVNCITSENLAQTIVCIFLDCEEVL